MTGLTTENRVRRFAACAGAVPLMLLPILAGCDPTDTPPGGNPTTDCSFPANQSAGLRIDCDVTGPLPSAKIDPANPAADACGPLTFMLFDQTINVPTEITLGENGEDSVERIRLGVKIKPSTQTGKLAKAAGDGCTGHSGPEFPVNTTFKGKHVARIDKRGPIACVYESRLTFDSYEQTVGVGIAVPIADSTRATVKAALKRRLDLEMARAINQRLKPRANINDAGFVGRAGRCEGDYKLFTE